MPAFVRTARDLSQFWTSIKPRFNNWHDRRAFLYEEFSPLLDYLEGKYTAPADRAISDALSTFDADGVHAVWEKALARQIDDPEGAITSARTLLETVCKRILDAEGEVYTDTEDLPPLYGKVAKLLHLAPSQHTEETFKALLGNCQQVVERLGSLRNKIGDAHGKGGKPIRLAPRHAALAVNLAGTMATFLVDTYTARRAERGLPRITA